MHKLKEVSMTDIMVDLSPEGWDGFVDLFYKRKDLYNIEFCYACWHRLNDFADCEACEKCECGNNYRCEVSPSV